MISLKFSHLDNTTSFSFPSPPYTWNLNVVTHEIGHNIGANHTHLRVNTNLNIV